MSLRESILAVVTVVTLLPAVPAGADDSALPADVRTTEAVEEYIPDRDARGSRDPDRDGLSFAPVYLVGESLSLQLSGPRNQGLVLNEDTKETR